MSSQSSYVEFLIINVMVLEDEAYRWCLGDEGGALMNGVSTLIKESRESSLTFHHVRTQLEVGSVPPKREPSPEPNCVAP